ncbi:hypothetical protein O3P69_008999 [Scylla paramamosain]|uniref:Coiled-coil domain-containing protein 177 n=1 Tax=Scylla paramamosain TaxID=85552 RepID=A0AAW0TRN4_SCYPA
MNYRRPLGADIDPARVSQVVVKELLRTPPRQSRPPPSRLLFLQDATPPPSAEHQRCGLRRRRRWWWLRRRERRRWRGEAKRGQEKVKKVAMREEEGVRLDLYNYDLPQNASRPHILTSPRSLQACRRLGIRQPREEFEATHPSLPLAQRLVAYQAQERRRLSTHSSTQHPQPSQPAPATLPFYRLPGEPYRASVEARSPSKTRKLKKSPRKGYPAGGLASAASHVVGASGVVSRPQIISKGFQQGFQAPRSVFHLPVSDQRGVGGEGRALGSGTWPGGRRRGASSIVSAAEASQHRPRITWASAPPRYHGTSSQDQPGAPPKQPLPRPPPAAPPSLTPLTLHRRPSDSSPSPASSHSDDSDDGSRSANSTAECDRQDHADPHDLPRPRSPSPGRLPPRLPVVRVVPCWSPSSDTTSLTPSSTPRLTRRQMTPIPPGGGAKKSAGGGGGGGGGRHTLSKRRVHSARPASATHHHHPHHRLPPTLAAARSLDHLTGPGSETQDSGPAPTTPRRAMSATSCRSHRSPRPSSALSARSPGQRRGEGGDPGGGEGPCWSPRLLPHHRSVSTVSLADSAILAKFMDGLDNMQLPARDVRLLELLVKKHERLYEEHNRSQQAHRAWLLQKERDTKARRVEERRSAESARKEAQEAALRAREEAEERKRQHLIQMWEQQQRLVEQRRREREEFFRRRVAEGNLAETEQQEARRQQVEARGEALLAAMRSNMEERLARAEANLRLLNEAREDTLCRQRDERERRAAAVRALHNQLEASMMQWRQHILTRQLEAMAAAEARQEQYLRSRANRIYAERNSRHIHHHHLLQQVLAREEAELAMVRRCLDAKDTRSQELARERERQVARARSTAHTTAALRDNLKKKLAPETFDKVVARANLELRIENRPPATSSMGTRSHIFLG